MLSILVTKFYIDSFQILVNFASDGVIPHDLENPTSWYLKVPRTGSHEPIRGSLARVANSVSMLPPLTWFVNFFISNAFFSIMKFQIFLTPFRKSKFKFVEWKTICKHESLYLGIAELHICTILPISTIFSVFGVICLFINHHNLMWECESS